MRKAYLYAIQYRRLMYNKPISGIDKFHYILRVNELSEKELHPAGYSLLKIGVVGASEKLPGWKEGLL